MARVTDRLSSLGMGEDGLSVAYPETFVDDITTDYNEDIGVYEAKIAVLETDLAAKDSEIAALKIHNYELMTQVPSQVITEEDEEEEDADSDDEELDDESEDKSDLDKVFGE